MSKLETQPSLRAVGQTHRQWQTFEKPKNKRQTYGVICFEIRVLVSIRRSVSTLVTYCTLECFDSILREILKIITECAAVLFHLPPKEN